MPEAAKIRETIVAPDDTSGAAVVRLQISDVPLEGEHTAAIRMMIEVRLPAYEPPLLLGHFQREAMKVAQEALGSILQDLAKEVGGSSMDLNPKQQK